ncbi:MAG: thioredoxin domain-containing protein [Brucella anthropi]
MPKKKPGRWLDQPVDEEFDHILGPVDAPITLVEYGSYACPHCQTANDRIADVRQLKHAGTKMGAPYQKPID